MDKTNLPDNESVSIEFRGPDEYEAYQAAPQCLREMIFRMAKDARAVREAVPGWVLASERVPEIDVPVWVLMPGGGVMLGVRSEVDEGWAWCNTYNNVSYWQGKWTADDAELDDDYPVFAWHPLPDMSAAPTQDQENGS